MFHLMQLAPGVTNSDLELFFSLEDEQTPETIMSIAYSDSDSKEQTPPSPEDSENDSQLSEIPEIFQLEEQAVVPLTKLSLTRNRSSPTTKV